MGRRAILCRRCSTGSASSWGTDVWTNPGVAVSARLPQNPSHSRGALQPWANPGDGTPPARARGPAPQGDESRPGLPPPGLSGVRGRSLPTSTPPRGTRVQRRRLPQVPACYQEEKSPSPSLSALCSQPGDPHSSASEPPDLVPPLADLQTPHHPKGTQVLPGRGGVTTLC